MTRSTWQKLSISLAVLLLAGIGFTVAAGGPAGHRVASFFGHGGHHECGHPVLGGLLRQLDLSAEQEGRVDAMHEVMGSHREIFQEAHIALHETLVEAIEGGSLDEADLNVIVDHGIEELRRSVYTMTREISALVNSLDDGQRAILNEHIQAGKAAKESGHGHDAGVGYGHGAGVGHGHGHSD